MEEYNPYDRPQQPIHCTRMACGYCVKCKPEFRYRKSATSEESSPAITAAIILMCVLVVTFALSFPDHVPEIVHIFAKCSYAIAEFIWSALPYFFINWRASAAIVFTFAIIIALFGGN